MQDKYVNACEAPSWRLKLGFCTSRHTKILYLKSDLNDKGARCYAVDVKVLGKSKIHFHLAI